MRQFNKVAIIGVGLIGGSIGLAIKKRRLAGEVVGIFRRRSTLEKALKQKAIDTGTQDIERGVRGADLIIIATPVRLISSIAKKVSRYAENGAIITDVGSTKGRIVRDVKSILRRKPRIYFVGSHPMAGSEKTGVMAARGDLLHGSPCIVTCTKRTNVRALKKLVAFWKAMGARVSVMSPLEHDRRVSFISHLPHLVAFGIAGSVPAEHIRYAAEGFKDTTRVASSDPELWADIFMTNAKEVMKAARAFESYYKELTRAILKRDYKTLVALLEKAKRRRDYFAS